MFESKKRVSDANNEEGMDLYKRYEYDEALKRYKNNVNITEGLEKKRYTDEEL